MSRRYKDNIENIFAQVDCVCIEITQMSNDLVNKYCKDLDKTVNEIRDILNNSNSSALDNDMLENYILKISSQLYFTGSAQEDLGIKEDTCKALKDQVFNTAREKAEGTIADKNMSATLASQQETIVLTIYNRAYKKVKLRIEAGYEMLNSLKKVMNRRISEIELSQSRYIGGIQK